MRSLTRDGTAAPLGLPGLIPPHSLEAERAVLGNILRCLAAVTAALRAALERRAAADHEEGRPGRQLIAEQLARLTPEGQRQAIP